MGLFGLSLSRTVREKDALIQGLDLKVDELEGSVTHLQTALRQETNAKQAEVLSLRNVAQARDAALKDAEAQLEAWKREHATWHRIGYIKIDHLEIQARLRGVVQDLKVERDGGILEFKTRQLLTEAQFNRLQAELNGMVVIDRS